MRNIIKIFKHDLKNVAKNLIVFIVIIGISIVPALYSWFNIAANWDPYSSTNGIAFAVCNDDKGYTYKAIGINAGDEIVSNLKQNKNMGWTFVTKQEALDGVDDGTFYAAVIIPEKFSENLCSIITGEFNQAILEYYVNEKKNAIAPKITNTGINTVKEQISSTYVNTITTVIATTLNLTTDQISSGKTDAANTLVDTLGDLNKEIDSFKSSIDVLSSTITSLDDIVKTSKEALPNIKNSLNESADFVSNTKNTVTSAKNASMQISSSIDNILTSVQDSAKSIDSRISTAFNNIENSASDAAEELSSITRVNSQIITVTTRIIEILQNIQDNFGIDMSVIIGKLENFNSYQQGIIDRIENTASLIEHTGTIPNSAKDEILSFSQNAVNEINSVKSAFLPIKTTIDNAVNKSYDFLDDVTLMIKNISGEIPNVEKSFDSASTSLNQIKTTFDGIKTFMENSQKKVDSLIEKIEALRDNNTIENFLSTIIENPNALGDFVSSPVTTVTHSVHHVDNYGSGMTPFYTALGFWVGGTILVAIVKTDLSKKELRELGRVNSTELFLGRYLIFFFIGQLQAWIISLGDILFLKVQCNDPVLFIIGSLISSFVYTLIIYSLTITFSVVGKALAIIILVMQVAGSGGTFPIEVLPAPFQTIAPYLPFKYGINILREAVAGPSMDSYIYNTLMLLAFVPFALVLGLLLRKPCIKLISFFDSRVEQSDIII